MIARAWPRYLSRRQAADFLREEWGQPVARTEKTLAKLASKGGGPAITYFGTRPAYTPRHLNEWAVRIALVRTSTSDQGRALRDDERDPDDG
jgi:uncharacterized protein YbjT (DUF2867 family)